MNVATPTPIMQGKYMDRCEELQLQNSRLLKQISKTTLKHIKFQKEVLEDYKKHIKMIENLVYVLERAWSSKNIDEMSKEIETVRDDAIKLLEPWREK